MQNRTTPIASSKGPGAPAAKKPELVTQPAVVRERTVKRFIAFCPFGDSDFNARKPMTPHTTKDAATVETVRHIREAHADSLFEERKAISRAEVVRKAVGVELIDE